MKTTDVSGQAKMLELLKPYARAVKFGALYRCAVRNANHQRRDTDGLANPPLAFVVGCGRSGTTILGKLLMRHPGIYYLFEPYHLWAAVEPRADALNLYSGTIPRIILDTRDVSDETRIKFGRLFQHKAKCVRPKLLVEKTPLNAMRIGFLNALAPNSLFIHIVRDGGDVSQSIARLSGKNSYRIAGKPTLNQWWGVDAIKWRTLKADGIEAGYFSNEVHLVEEDPAGRGAYEWLVSLREIDRWRGFLANRLLQLSYDDLTCRPFDSLSAICGFLGVEVSQAWLNFATAQLQPPRCHTRSPLPLPCAMAEAFNVYQERFCFESRAEVVSSFSRRHECR